MFAIALIDAAQSGLTARGLISNIPHDGPAIVVYAMMLAFIVLIWRANRRGRRS